MAGHIEEIKHHIKNYLIACGEDFMMERKLNIIMDLCCVKQSKCCYPYSYFMEQSYKLLAEGKTYNEVLIWLIKP